MKKACSIGILFTLLMLFQRTGDAQTFAKNDDQTSFDTFNLNPYVARQPVSYFLQTNQKINQDTVTTMDRLTKFTNWMEWYMKYFPMPFASYSDETDLLFGISKYNAFKMRKGDKTDTITQASSISFFGYFTFNDQYKTVLESNLMLNKNKALWHTLFVYTDYPLEYFGTGNETSLEDQQTLVTSDWEFGVHYLFKTWKKWYVGPAFNYVDYNKVKFLNSIPTSSDSALVAKSLGRQSGLGVKVQMEGRDNRLNAKSGFYVDANYQIFNKAFGSQFNYNFFLTDVRYYTTPWKKLTIAMQVRTEAKSGDVPVQTLSQLGGDYAMRGTYRGRYRDLVAVDTQMELRFPIFWIFGGTIFNSLGQVAPSYKDLSLNAFHYNYGFGLRLKVDSAHDINLRFDYGISKDQTYFIVNFAEAF